MALQIGHQLQLVSKQWQFQQLLEHAESFAQQLQVCQWNNTQNLMAHIYQLQV
jgi:hypothetical protein